MSTSLLEIGTIAPRFTAPANDGRTYSLEALLAQGAVALFFYPGNNTPG
jgi:peroxiredoxin Q/BCP